MVSLGDNIGTTLVAMGMMGFNVAHYHGLQINPVARRVADANSGGKIIRNVLGHDVMEGEEEEDLMQLGHVDVLIMTSDCGDWSTLLDHLEGFEAKGGEFFMKGGDIKTVLEKMFPEMMFWGEPNCISTKRGLEWKVPEQQQQEMLMEVEMWCQEWAGEGSGASRFRKLFSSIDWMDYERIGAGNPDDNLEIRMMSMKRPAPRLVAAGWNTRQPMIAKCEQLGSERHVCADEADREFGYAAGVSCGYGEVALAELEGLELIGNAVSFYHCRVLFGHYS